eukprot:TRINITY_DN7964_c0_g1_i1.p1 TRINITY_DN7964_c0_g1~~TRINITY_DN7964_c0_g1_i1.p1  ORF type:complete len:435 (-),score=57.60 TRINITY_DN7964_c0_g1_i1:78-1382(-)
MLLNFILFVGALGDAITKNELLAERSSATPGCVAQSHPLLRFDGCNLAEGRKYQALFDQEHGFPRAREVLDDLLTPDEQLCRKRRQSDSGTPYCIQPSLFGGLPYRQTIREAFSPSELATVRRVLRWQLREGRYLDTRNLLKATYPFVSNEAYRDIADIICDKPKRGGCAWSPGSVANRSIVFAARIYGVNMLRDKLRDPAMPHIFLLTPDNDHPVYLTSEQDIADHPKVLLWFARNGCRGHPKIVRLPIGIRSELVRDMEEAWGDVLSDNFGKMYPPMKRLLVAFNVYPQSDVRHTAIAQLGKLGYKNLYRAHMHDFWKVGYQQQIQEHRFIASPTGLGLDHAKTWETLYLGRIPILQLGVQPGVIIPRVNLTRTYLPMYDDFPVHFIKFWGQLTNEYLDRQWGRMREERYDTNKLWFPWWLLFIVKSALLVP